MLPALFMSKFVSGAEPMSVKECCLDAGNNVADIVVGDAGAAGKAEAGPEELFADPVDISRSIPVDWLLVHGLPQRAGLDAGCIQGHPHGLDIAVGFAVCMKCSGGVGYSGCSAHGSLYCRLIGVLLALDTQPRVKDNGVEPVVAAAPGQG